MSVVSKRKYKMISQMTVHCIALVLCALAVPIATQTVEVGNDYAIDKQGEEWINSLFYIPSEPRVRREYRMLSEEEHFMLTDAFVKMKNDTSIKPNKYDLLASLHARRSTRNSAHRGTGFLGWHRVYTLLMENALREWYPDITMAYWDTTLDAVLELPRESCLWSTDFMGNGDGYVKTGAFNNWKTQKGFLYRTVGVRFGPLDDRNISHLLEFKHIGNISFPMNGKNEENIFEEIHNRVHHFVGGEMVAIETAADDPFFFPYHSFISYIWQEFRAVQRENGIDPETDWDLYYGQAKHHKYSPMGLGNLMAIDGSSEIFAENIIFDERPYCSRDDPDCKTPYLYCNVTVEKCCPWTIREYDIIKTVSVEKNIAFSEAVLPFILNNVQKGFSEVAELTDENVTTKYGQTKYDPDNDLFILHEASHTTIAPPAPTKNTLDNIMKNMLGDQGDDHSEGHDHDHNEGYDDDHNESHDHDHNDGYDDDYSEGHDHNDGYDDDHNESHDHDHSESHDHDHNEGHGHSHHHHEHSHGKVIQHIHHDHMIYNSNDFWSNYLLIILLGCLVTFRIVFGIVTKCRRESACCCKASQNYEMDGIVNVNFVEEENKKKKNTNNHVSRSDNVYSVTVTSKEESQLEHNGRYVKFVKYHNGEADKPGESTVPEAQQKTVDSGRTGNYLDMTHATVLSNASDQREGMEVSSSDMFENESLADEDVDKSYNSIENENFDYIRQAIREAEGGRSEDSFDVFDTYDNLEFKREANRCMGIKPDCDEEFYVNYFPGTHM